MPAIKRHQKTIAELKTVWLRRAQQGGYPFEHTPLDVAQAALAQLQSFDDEPWVDVFSRAARPYLEAAQAAEANRDSAAAKLAFLRAYGCLRLARFPCPSSVAKRRAYERSREVFLAAARYFSPPLERVTIPFPGRPGEGTEIVGYLRVPEEREHPHPIVVMWTGTDTYKEDRLAEVDQILAHGLAVLNIDMPGTGEAPILGSLDAERMFAAVLDWLPSRPELDARRTALYAGSFGGYWGVKVAHLMPERIACAVVQGGGVHFNFLPEWTEKMQWGDYPFDQAETRGHSFGLRTFEEWAEYAPRLSLLEAGLLHRPCAPMLVVNGSRDTISPIEDSYLLLKHGRPKAARFYPTGHMGFTPDTLPTILRWIDEQLG